MSKQESDMAKGEKPRDASYAKGGGQLGRTRDFMKETDGKDQFMQDATGRRGKPYVNLDGNASDYKEGPGAPKEAKRTGDKSLKTVKPRS